MEYQKRQYFPFKVEISFNLAHNFRYCKTKKPKVTSAGDITVAFTSDKKKRSSEAVCEIKCTLARIPAVTCLGGNCKEGQTRTKVAMLLSQSDLLHSLNQVQRDKFLEASQINGLILPQQCPIETLTRCNEDQNAIKKCINDGLNDGLKDLENCVDKFCPLCGCELSSLLGFDCDSQDMVRFMQNTSQSMEEFGNRLSGFVYWLPFSGLPRDCLGCASGFTTIFA